MGAYGASAYGGAYTGEDEVLSSARPYVEQDKASRTTAIFEGITGTVNSLSDFYARIKYNAQPVYGAPAENNSFFGGGVSYVPGRSGEPTKLSFGGGAGPLILLALGAVVLLVVMRR